LATWQKRDAVTTKYLDEQDGTFLRCLRLAGLQDFKLKRLSACCTPRQ
jgi:hypothetical protein